MTGLSVTTLALADVAMLLKEMRREAGMSQRVVAERMGVSQPVIARWESGGDVPRASYSGRSGTTSTASR